ncbi:3-hydroxyacyl-CoA dehydrogenase NAD-binding domain-containing protein [Aquisediminimonas sediminicola]|uniref:3-hydroxyacyl-CoA dehydrogenase NAD-binding domain-containing protein n=1 Tax=Alteraquisediminimonas sediminicola TaxID=2676787 RepID=UPI001C8DD835|nr:3-hydroxyacyl-CoA dehydrogenase NAD-binding domain-containing protein [Aquisediminimonas sediminicola]
MAKVSNEEICNGIGVLEIDSPPVNALGAQVRCALDEGLRRMMASADVKAILIICAGRTFFAGADISEFGKAIVGPDLGEIFTLIEMSDKPVVAAIHGSALGGGLELALACHYRIAVPSAKLGLPEVKLGLLPGAGGTQRLPRIVGVETALDLIVSGRAISAHEARTLGVVDMLATEGGLRDDAIAYARSVLDQPLVRVRDRQDRLESAHGKPEIFADFRKKNARSFRGFKAPENIVKAIEAVVNLPFDEGLKREWALFKELEASIESLAQRYYFFAERETTKIPDVPKDIPTIPIATVGVIGAGTMGGGIAMNFLNIGLPVVLVEMSEAALDRGLGVIRRNYENATRKGRMTAADVEQRMGLIRPALDFAALADVDLVIEAVFEEMEVKKDIFRKLDRATKPGAILASNTSFLDLDEIAAATSRPEWVVGLHFFSPANVMQLLEVVRGRHTSKSVIATAMKLAKTIGKVPVLSKVCNGFIANRIMAQRQIQADALVLEGPSPQEIDQAVFDYGFAMGPFQMIDLVGLDVIGRGATTRSVAGDLVAMGRLGQKQAGGYYDYDEHRHATPSPVAAEVIASFAVDKGVVPSGKQAAADILARLLFPVVNEGAKLLEEGIALRASDIDVAAILGYNWPVYTGGPMFWADTIGLQTIVDSLRALETRYGAAFTPSKLLVELAKSGGSFTRG